MTVIWGKLFGAPTVSCNEEEITFPYKKAEALFYYLLIKKQAFRDTLVGLLWGAAEEEVAKKSLRNAVYVINKSLSCDVLVSPKRSVIMLNPLHRYNTDVDMLAGDAEGAELGHYSGDFLDGFFVKDAEGFDKWMITSRNQYRDIYIGKLQKQIQGCIRDKQPERVALLCKELVAVDEFNEKAYRLLMNVYRKMGQLDKCIEIYNCLSNLLRNELFITPDRKTDELFAEIIKEKAARQADAKTDEGEYFYGRRQELYALNESFHNFIIGKRGKSILVLGEAGLGKTTLVERHLKCIDTDSVIMLKSNCYQVEENYLLKPWNEILYQLSQAIDRENIELPTGLQRIVNHVFPGFTIKDNNIDSSPMEQVDILKYQIAEKAIVDIFKKVANQKKTLIMFEDIQWIDAMSLSLMRELMLESRNQAISFIVTSRAGYSCRIERFIADMKAYGLLKIIELNRFNKSETIELASGMLPGHDIDEALGSSIYKETEGNTFFIVELVNSMKYLDKPQAFTPRMQDILNSRFLHISEEGKKLLNIISVFFDRITLEELLEISGKSELELMDVISELEEKNLIKEDGDTKDVGFAFTHQKLREFVYSQLTASKKKILHIKIARLLESRLRGSKHDLLLFSKLIYHFENGGHRLSTLKYKIKNLEQFLSINHEIFPVAYEDSVTENGFVEISEEQIVTDFNSISQLINEIKEAEGICKELECLELSFMHMVGRGFIRSGDYRKGLFIIEHMIRSAVKAGESGFALKGYKQMTYFCINTYNTKLMESYIEEAIAIAEQCGLQEEKGILLRLKGMQRIMAGSFAEGEELLLEAISMLESHENKEKYALNIAAAYNFIGESKRRSKAFCSAFDYYDRAISLCKGKALTRGIPIFNTNAGQAAYDMGDYAKAREYFQNAIDAYKRLSPLWGCSTAYGYMAMLLIGELKLDEGLAYITKAEAYAKVIQNPYEMALICRVKAEVRKKMEQSSKIYEQFRHYLIQSTADYCEEGISLLKDIGNCYELKILESLKA